MVVVEAVGSVRLNLNTKDALIDAVIHDTKSTLSKKAKCTKVSFIVERVTK